MEKDCPTFEEAIERWRGFLKQQGKVDKILWIGLEDVAYVKGKIWVKKLDLEGNYHQAYQKYKTGIERGLGVQFLAICQLKNKICCYIFIPDNEEHAQRMFMFGGLKLSIPIELPNAKSVWCFLQWKFLRKRELPFLKHKLFLFHEE